MILVDTSVWVDHLRTGVDELAELLDAQRVLTHPWVIGELALGHLRSRDEILALLLHLPAATVATESETLALIERHRLSGAGIGYVDVQLLASARLAAVPLWTFDKGLAAVAARVLSS